jgi:hypothetical protein
MTIAGLSWRLVAIPEHGWPRLAAACDAGQPLPGPLSHAAVFATASVLATVLGAAVHPGTSAGLVAAHGLLALLGYLGGAVAAVYLGAARVPAPEPATSLRRRYAASATLPMLASGVLNLVPLYALTLLWTAAGIGLMAWSAWIGASAFLGAEGPRRKSSTIAVTTAAGVPALGAALVRALLL